MTGLLLGIYLFTLAAGLGLRFLNLRHMRRRGGRVPAGFEGSVDPQQLARSAEYTVANSRLALIESLLDAAVTVAFLFGGLLPLYDRWVGTLAHGFIFGGLLFFGGLALAQMLLQIPFSLYRTFRLEARFGFNTTTFGLWLSDLAKSVLLGAALLGLLAAGALALIQAAPRTWWLWVWVFFALLSLFLMYVSPYLIEPLFFKFAPVPREELKEQIRALMARAGITAGQVLQVDASRRSRHSNAYFTGIGRVKRIVLFDTLLEQMSDGETLAILAHEAGHWKKGHVRRRLLVTELLTLLVCYGSFHLLQWPGLPGLLGLGTASFYARVLILGFLGSLLAFPFTPLSSWLSRRQEWQADRYARDLTGEPQDLASALVKLSAENLSNLHPHPLYAAVYYSHPPMVARVARLRE
jgi:STE24 endopeptidase